MLSLKQIVKEYKTGNESVSALKGVDIEFRESEFVSILGQSGCGKTTLLNIIGGLDRYTSGDLVINGKSTKQFKDSDWDTYRNHSIGFVFQSYNLIPHQSVLSNVELALTLSGVSKTERRKRAVEVLEKVGLGDQLNKKPNQMSGGQMQRVAIARALINNPDILLADEPTGALDSATSVQIMEILKDISKDKLIIMVTHNPELAEEYSSRTIKLLDGKIIDDSDPYTANVVEPIKIENKAKADEKKGSKTSMSFLTALSLSKNNLLTKKARTLLTSFAGSIGIIGIALILSLSNGVQTYIDNVQEDTLSTYPLTIDSTTTNLTAMMEAMANIQAPEEKRSYDKVYSGNKMSEMLNIMMSESSENNLTDFKNYLDNNKDVKEFTTDVKYSYSTVMNIYKDNTDDGIVKVNPSQVYDALGMGSQITDMQSMSSITSISPMANQTSNIWSEMIDNEDIIKTQYEVLAGRTPTKYNEIVVVVNKYNEIDDFALYSLGLRDVSELTGMMTAMMNMETFESEIDEYSYDDILNLKYKLVLNTDYYEKQNNKWIDKTDDEDYMKTVISNGVELKVVGILRPNDDASAASISGSIGYRSDLMKELIDQVNESEIVKEQKATPEINVFTGEKFPIEDDGSETAKDEKKASDTSTAENSDDTSTKVTREQMLTAISYDKMSNEEKTQIDALSDEDLAKMVAAKTADSSANENLTREQMLAAISYDKMSDEEKVKIDALSDEDLAKMITSMNDITKDGNTLTREQMLTAIDYDNLSDEEKAQVDSLSDEQLAGMIEMMSQKVSEIENDTTYEENLTLLGVTSIDTPSSISIYPKDFASKEKIEDLIKEYNDNVTADNHEENIIQYTDMVGLMMSSITDIINAISYVLIAFVGISLVVSSIMIGIITYISVLERTKEIGILRSIGASKKDISRVFNAETIIIGFVAGALGIGLSYLLTIPINAIISNLTTAPVKAAVPLNGAIILVVISVFLTFIAGLIPSKIAAKKDPVVALRTD